MLENQANGLNPQRTIESIVMTNKKSMATPMRLTTGAGNTKKTGDFVLTGDSVVIETTDIDKYNVIEKVSLYVMYTGNQASVLFGGSADSFRITDTENSDGKKIREGLDVFQLIVRGAYLNTTADPSRPSQNIMSATKDHTEKQAQWVVGSIDTSLPTVQVQDFLRLKHVATGQYIALPGELIINAALT